ncbi:hypothetical protein [Hamadaea tsunoensis]|uniref:hypothetical protein n=1 Tax=Hamadaea tsunoensis TaxID=53368 RepID=UPI00040B76BC|nr:hypothetical protein [Hamadaea tsunoensis]
MRSKSRHDMAREGVHGVVRSLYLLFIAAITITSTAVVVGVASPTYAAAPPLGNTTSILNDDGRLEVFAASGTVLYHNFQTSPGGGWSGWISLGQPSGGLWNGPSVAKNSDGRLEVFATSLGALYHAWQDSHITGGWSGWAKIADLSSPSAPTAVKNLDGRLEVFVGNAQGIWHAWQDLSRNWSGLANLGMTVDGHTLGSGAISVGVNSDGRLELVALDTYNIVMRIYQLSSGGAWSGWTSMGGGCRPAAARSPHLMPNQDGRLELFIMSPIYNENNASLCHRWQWPTFSGGWSGWAELGGTSLDTMGGFAWTQASDRLVVLARDTHGTLYTIEQTAPNGSWSGFTQRSASGYDASVSIVANGDGRWELFANRNGQPYHAWQTSVGGPLSGWVPLESN